MLTPVVIGLPGSGKSTLAAAVAERLGVGVFRSDRLFRICRALSVTGADPRRAIHEAFLHRIARSHPDHLERVRADVQAVDGHDGPVLAI